MGFSGSTRWFSPASFTVRDEVIYIQSGTIEPVSSGYAALGPSRR